MVLAGLRRVLSDLRGAPRVPLPSLQSSGRFLSPGFQRLRSQLPPPLHPELGQPRKKFRTSKMPALSTALHFARCETI